MTYSDFLLLYARKGFCNAFRKSAYRKFCRRNIGREITVKCKKNFFMNTIIGDSVDNQIAVYKIYENGTTHVVENLAAESSTFLDIGCNIGYYSCLFGTKSPGKSLFAIDPNPEMIKRTKENLDINNIGNCQMLNYGIGKQRETLLLNVPFSRHSLSSFAYVPKKGGISKPVAAKIHTLHEVLSEYPIEASLIKIDTEGFEYKVFCGLSEKVIAKIRFIIFELSASNLQLTGDSVGDIVSLPLLKNFEVYLIKNEKGGFVEKINPISLVKNNAINTNILLVKKDSETMNVFRRSSICTTSNIKGSYG